MSTAGLFRTPSTSALNDSRRHAIFGLRNRREVATIWSAVCASHVVVAGARVTGEPGQVWADSTMNHGTTAIQCPRTRGPGRSICTRMVVRHLAQASRPRRWQISDSSLAKAMLCRCRSSR
jgi:hypothetical protein